MAVKNTFVLKGKTFGDGNYSEDIKDVGTLMTKLKDLLLDSEFRSDRVLVATLEIETVKTEVPSPLDSIKTNKMTNQCEEMHCTRCGAITGHDLKPNKFNINTNAWTCAICDNQKK